MKLKFLGTAAAEAIPALFCSCDVCMTSRKLGGKNLRKRSSVLLDDCILFDFTSDILSCIHAYQLDLFTLEHMLITHSHSDHFNCNDLGTKLPVFSNPGNPPLHVHANAQCIAMAEDLLPQWGDREGSVYLHTVESGRKFNIGEYSITPLRARHTTQWQEEVPLVYLVTKGGKSLLYGNDSGIYYEEVLDCLGSQHLDCMILDCTNGYLEWPVGGHMGLKDNLTVVNMLREKGAVDDRTIVISTHFSHNGGIIYDRDCDCFRDQGVIMAFDGMEITL